MSVRNKLMWWFSAILVISLVIVGYVTYYEFVLEPRAARARGEKLDPGWEEIGEVALEAGLPCLLLAIVGVWWLTHNAFKPLERLTMAAESIHAGNLKQRLSVSKASDEIARLTRVFNAMTARLDESFERVRQFTLNASHELKTPLTIIRSELETALHAPGTSAAEQERTANLLDEVERLANIVDALTFLTKADAGLATFRREPIRLDELLREAHADAEVLAAHMQVHVQIGQSDAVTIVGDRHRIRQLLLILTDNAVKYNEPGGLIFLGVANHGETPELRVTNTGPGITPAEIPRVFDRFFRGHAADITGSEGCGLGLSVARSIVSAHGAEIAISSEANGLTAVIVRFPSMPVRAPAEELATAN